MLLAHYKGSASFGPSTGEQFRHRRRWFHARTSQWICSLDWQHIHILRAAPDGTWVCALTMAIATTAVAAFRQRAVPQNWRMPPLGWSLLCEHSKAANFVSITAAIDGFVLFGKCNFLLFKRHNFCRHWASPISVGKSCRRSTLLLYLLQIVLCLITVAFASHYFPFDPMMVHR